MEVVLSVLHSMDIVAQLPSGYAKTVIISVCPDAFDHAQEESIIHICPLRGDKFYAWHNKRFIYLISLSVEVLGPVVSRVWSPGSGTRLINNTRENRGASMRKGYREWNMPHLHLL